MFVHSHGQSWSTTKDVTRCEGTQHIAYRVQWVHEYNMGGISPQRPRPSRQTPSNLELAERRSRDRLARRLGTLAEHLGGLVSTETTTPLTALVLVLVRAGSRQSATLAHIKMDDMTHKLALAAETRVASSRWSSDLTSWRVRTAAVFLWTTVPRRALPLTMT
jgi:hypothetical protein